VVDRSALNEALAWMCCTYNVAPNKNAGRTKCLPAGKNKGEKNREKSKTKAGKDFYHPKKQNLKRSRTVTLKEQHGGH
jgi:hypothetical protein